MQNAYIESFNGKFRDECLNEHWFSSLVEADAFVEAWRRDYNTVRPLSCQGYRTPEKAVGEKVSYRDSMIIRWVRIGLRGWTKALVKMGVFQARVVFSLFYLLGVAPIAIIFKLRADPFGLKMQGDSNWLTKDEEPHSITGARRQY